MHLWFDISSPVRDISLAQALSDLLLAPERAGSPPKPLNCSELIEGRQSMSKALSLSLSLSLSPPYLSLSKLSFSLGLPFSLTSFLPVCPVISFPFSFLPLCQFISLILVSLHLCITYRCLPEIVAIFYVDEARQSSLSRAVASLSLSRRRCLA